MDNTFKTRFKGEFNVNGQCITEYTIATHIQKAYRNFLHKISKKHNIPYSHLRMLFYGHKDNYRIQEIKS